MGRFQGARASPGAPGVSPKPTNDPVPVAGPPFGVDDNSQPDMAGANSRQSAAEASAQDLGGYNPGALVNPDAGLATNVPIAQGRKRKLPPPVAIGWGVLALLLIILAAMIALAPKTVVSMLPGAARLYAVLGKPVNTRGLAIQNVQPAWSDADGQRVLQVTGEIVNLTSSEVSVPTVVIALQDKTGKELSQYTAKVLPLAANGKSPFTVEIPSPPETVSALKVRFAKAD
ncbi:MAG TPA: FxLYD domain-containing protein [Methyloceanibacter sp.]|nr:FxLYD domain-containing protein [Methyloceanibacter sp.]